MWPCLVVFSDPHVHISLQFVDWTIYLFAERNTIELVERGLVEAFTDAVRLRALGLGARVIDVLDCQIQLVLVPFGIAAELAAAVSQHAQELDIVLLEEWQHAVIEQIGRRDGHLAVIELGKAYLGIGVDEGLLVDASNALQVADIERILGAAVPGCSLSNSPCASFSVLAFSSATTCASVSTRPSWALLASSALSRFFIVSRLWHSHTQRTPAGETVSPRCLSSLATRT